MRLALQALASELKRLKHEGLNVVSVSPETLGALRQAVVRRAQAAATDAVAEEPVGTGGGGERTQSGATPAGQPKAAAAATTAPAVAHDPGLPAPQPFTLPEGSKAERWAWLLERVTGDPVCRARVRPGKKVVLGVGDLDAKIMFVGEAPGAEEEVQGEPFVGPAGQLLTRMIQAMGLKREQVYIGNIMNWRPQLPTAEGHEQVGNRPPDATEMAYCLPNLRAQIEIVQPALIVALGATAGHGLLGEEAFKTLGEVRGRWKQFAGKPVMVTYHPSYILRNGSSRSKRAIWEDLLQVMARAELPISDKQRNYFAEK